MNILSIIFLMVVTGVIIWLARKPAGVSLERTRLIKAPAEKLYDTVRDFKTWPHWSAWLMHEPDTRLEFSPFPMLKAGWYTWDGKLVGAGKITHTGLVPPQRIEQRIEFTRPMRSKGEVFWTFTPVADGTQVSWGMRSKLPFLLRWLEPMIAATVSKDYDIGLGRLAQFVGDHSDPVDISFDGAREMPQETYIARRFDGLLSDLPAAARANFPLLTEAVAQYGLEQTGMPLTIYHKFDKKKLLVVCDMAIPVKEVKVADGFNAGKLPAQKYFRTTLKGEYQYLELAWHAATGHARMRKLKMAKGAPMLERYASDPLANSGVGVVTFIDLPVR
ncbi:MAG: SRPBCC family protein [Gammaproteobacteria bacterium]|nr:SRPBCC family protein [Gammaproteobacteria bacterium]MBU1724153.1 SRPBCC family protein [Gammaproteobacteria bacterium]MBU2006750.1 SRPBCC family protein [Gammaproteobacteria bacterium]